METDFFGATGLETDFEEVDWVVLQPKTSMTESKRPSNKCFFILKTPFSINNNSDGLVKQVFYSGDL